MNMLNHFGGTCFASFSETRVAHFHRRAALCGGALLLCFSLAASADEVQDINKLFKQGQRDQALGRINTYLAGKPKDAQARFLKGLILTDQNKTNDAIRVFSDLTEDYPELPEPYNNLAVLYASQGQYDKARTALEMAIRTHPSYATAHENLGDIYAKMASQAYDRALQLDRGNASTQTKLAMIKDLFTSDTAKGSKPGKAPHAVVAAAKPQPVTAPVQEVVATVATPVAAAAQTAKAPVEQPAEEKPAAKGDSKEVLKVVHAWAAAWSSRNVKDYLSFYAEDFKTPGGEVRANWEAQRSDRISRPKSIHVGISNAKVKFIDDTHASVSFTQSYHATHLKSNSGKTLVMAKSGGNWLIQEEYSGK